ncbi:hypothetical protein [Persicobacter diffluens]|uniref:hypothetical protein n=1 Tax=Persicobacter diffluens TaxID=981 RepID=UPI0030C664E0
MKFLDHDFIPKGGHMCVSPDNKTITVIANREDGETGKSIYLVYLEPVGDYKVGDVRKIELLNFNEDGIDLDDPVAQAAYYNNNYFKGKITQVDVDREGYLFIAGKSGFYRVVADNGNGTKDPFKVNGGKDIWSDEDRSLQGEFAGSVWAHVVPFTFNGDNYVETLEDGEDYFEDTTPFNPKRVKFLGGDILFTQNSDETNGFESQRLISFSQWKGNVAIALDLQWDWGKKEIAFNAGKLFGGSKQHGFHKNTSGKVTGACLIGDNHVMTSHHNTKQLQLWNLHGELLASVEMSGGFDGNHNWGDMASTQSFDHLVGEDSGESNREIFGDRTEDWYRGPKEENGHQYAEIKLYRPKGIPANYDVEDLDDNGGVPKESRMNAANADIAHYDSKGNRFVALGNNGGMAMLRFESPVSVADGVIQVVETSYGKKAVYETKEEANRAYNENATIYVAKTNPRYYESGFEDPSNWVKIGIAHISNNEFHLNQVEGLDVITSEISWVKIVDGVGEVDGDGSTTFDGFDLNFVAAYAGGCGNSISQENFTFEYDSDDDEIVLTWDFTADDLNISPTGGIQLWFKNGRQYDENRDQIGVNLFSVEEINAGRYSLKPSDFNFSGDDCIQEVSFSFHTICSRSSDGWVRGNVFASNQTIPADDIDYCTISCGPYNSLETITVDYAGNLDVLRVNYVNLFEINGQKYFRMRIRNATNAIYDFKIQGPGYTDLPMGTITPFKEIFVTVPSNGSKLVATIKGDADDDGIYEYSKGTETFDENGREVIDYCGDLSDLNI